MASGKPARTLLLWLLVITDTGCVKWAGHEQYLPSVILPTPSAQTTLQDRSAFSYIDLCNLQADYLVIEVFNTRCSYCIESVSELNRLYFSLTNEFSKNGPQLIMFGIGLNDTTSQTYEFKEKFAVAFPLLADPEGVTYTKWKIRHTPTLLVVRNLGRQLEILYRHIGIVRQSHAEEIKEILRREITPTRQKGV